MPRKKHLSSGNKINILLNVKMQLHAFHARSMNGRKTEKYL